MSLKFYSTNLESDHVTFPEALLRGQAPDRGLYMPASIPRLSLDEMEEFRNMEYWQIALKVIGAFLEGQIGMDELAALVKDAYDFDVPLEHVCDRKYIMRLDQGPTASFKDFAARMMGRLMDYYLRKEKKQLLILTATSGDTGSAIANAFLGLPAIKVVVLFPEKEVTARQRKQMTTLGQNIQILALDAKFDDCQALVKEAFADPELRHLNLSSANSINIGRLIPQAVYYFYAWSVLAGNSDVSGAQVPAVSPASRQIIFSVPSGNFGDMMGGMLAMKMGLPVKKFIIAVNENDEFPRYLQTGIYSKIEPSKNCISSAMNVGHPSNLARLVALYRGVMDEKGGIHHPADLETMRGEIWSTSIADTETRECIRETWTKHKTLLEPHGAVGWAGLLRYLEEHPEDDNSNQVCVSLETAHPAKFPEEIQKLLGFDPAVPPALTGLEGREENYLRIEKDYGAFKKYLLGNY